MVAVLLAGCGPGESPTGPAPIVWTDTSRLLNAGTAPLHLQVRLTSDGRIALRTVAADERAWVDRGAWPLGGTPVEMDRAYTSLRDAMTATAAAPRHREPDGTSAARLLVDADPDVPWERVHWTLMVAMHPRVRVVYVAFLSEEFTPVEVELPRARSGPGVLTTVDGFLMQVKTLRPKGGRAFTRLRASWEPVQLDADGLEERGDDPDGVVVDSEAPEMTTVDLSPDDAPTLNREKGWGEFEDYVRQKSRVGSPWVAVLSAPPPTGGLTPYRDSVRVLSILRQSGPARLWIEGALAPLLTPQR
jgi:hypothetical protein